MHQAEFTASLGGFPYSKTTINGFLGQSVKVMKWFAEIQKMVVDQKKNIGPQKGPFQYKKKTDAEKRFLW